MITVRHPQVGVSDTDYFHLARVTYGAAYADPGRAGEFEFPLVSVAL